MNEKIKQTIEEMELVMHNSFGCRYFSTKDMILNNDRFFNREATAIYNAGYRKESDTAREILDMIDGVPTNEVNELNHLRLLKNAIVKRYGVDLTEDKE